MYKIWIDEAWRGPWFWDVVACSLTFENIKDIDKWLLLKIRDSKKLTHKKREEIFNELIKLSLEKKVYFGVWVVDNHTIDQINIKQANKLAMERSLAELLRKIDNDKIIWIFVDGNDNYKFENTPNIKSTFIIGWDDKVVEISAASIIAKVFRDKLVDTYSVLYPNLEAENHKWYWTKKHIEYLKTPWNITSFHRISYKPVKAILDKKTKILVHTCCGIDAIEPILKLKKDYEVICFWDNSNITDKKEHEKRVEAFKKVCDNENISYIENTYNPKEFLEILKDKKDCPEWWERCFDCYKKRLENTYFLAKELNIPFYTTSLTTSPHKNLEYIFQIWDELNKLGWPEFLKIAFRKNNWFKKSMEYAKELWIYIQNYCWCVYSKREKD